MADWFTVEHSLDILKVVNEILLMTEWFNYGWLVYGGTFTKQFIEDEILCEAMSFNYFFLSGNSCSLSL